MRSVLRTWASMVIEVAESANTTGDARERPPLEQPEGFNVRFLTENLPLVYTSGAEDCMANQVCCRSKVVVRSFASFTGPESAVFASANEERCNEQTLRNPES